MSKNKEDKYELRAQTKLETKVITKAKRIYNGKFIIPITRENSLFR